MDKQILVVGAGFYGAVCAHELKLLGHSVHVIEKRNHIGGNCFTRLDNDVGCIEHVYGPHVFHTSSKRIWNYIRQFAEFNRFVNRIKVNYQNKLYSFPINLFTLYQLYGITTPEEAELKFNQIRIPIDNPSNLEEYCLATVGPDIYQIFIEGYTTKQWNCHPRDLSTSIVKRIPIRLTFDDNYYDSLYQGVPIEGYTVIIEKMMDGIQVDLNIDFLDDRDYLLNKYDHVIYTGTIDAFFNYCYGVLGYRSLRFEKELIKTSDFQGNAIINYTDATVPWTRIIEHKHFDRKSDSKQTIITREYPTDWKPGGIEFYPVNNKQNYDLLRKYENEAEKLTEKVHFGGRLGKYRYYDMDQVIASALKFCDSFK